MSASGPYLGSADAAGARQPSSEVITPEAVGLELPTGTVGSRGVAYLLDLLVLFSGFLLIGIATAVLGGGGFVDGWLAILLLLLVAFAWQFGYPVAFEVATRGRTPGKMAMGLRVVTVEGGPIAFRHAVIRAVVGLLELLATIGAVAVVTSLVSARGQRLGDLAAGTMVVRERRIGGPPTAVRFAPPPALQEYAARLDTSAITPAEYACVRDTLLRAPRLPAIVRGRITTMLATMLAQRVTPPPPAGVGPEEWLMALAAAVQRRTWLAAGAGAGAGASGLPSGPASTFVPPPTSSVRSEPADDRSRPPGGGLPPPPGAPDPPPGGGDARSERGGPPGGFVPPA